MDFLHLTVWSSRARLTSDVVLLCKEAPSTVCWANLRANFVFSHQEVQVSILEQIFLGPLSCPRKLRLVQVPIFPPLSSSLRFPKVARQHRLKIHFEKNSCQNLLVTISLKIRSPFWTIEVPFPCGSGDIDIECILVYCFYILVFLYCSICPLLAGAHAARHSLPRFPRLLFCKECLPIVCARHNGGDNNVVICCWMLSVFSYIVFICLYFHIFVLCISISVSFCCFLIFCIFRFSVPLVHGARDCLLLWTPFKKKTSYLNPT